MKIIYSGQNLKIEGPSVFLAGCTSRKGQTLLWRQPAIELFKEYGFNGTLIVPEPKHGQWADYLSVIEWENEYLTKCDKILFWVPRVIDNGILGLTTNVEFGKWLALTPKRVWYGRPNDSDNNRYLDYWYHKETGLPPFDTLEKLVYTITLNLE